MAGAAQGAVVDQSTVTHYMSMANEGYNEAVNAEGLPNPGADDYDERVKAVAMATRKYFFGVFSIALEDSKAAAEYFQVTSAEVMALHESLPEEARRTGDQFLANIRKRLSKEE